MHLRGDFGKISPNYGENNPVELENGSLDLGENNYILGKITPK